MLRRTLIGAAVTLALAVTPALAQTKSEGQSKPPAKAKKARPESARLQVYVQGDSAFDPGASELKAEGKSQLDKMLKTAKDGSKRDPRPLTITSVVISGHTDKLEADPDKLSLARALAVKDYLLSKGVSEKVIFWEGKGAKSPVPVTKFCDEEMAKDQLVACLQPNRRVVVEVGGTKPPKPKKK